jgi:PiT family inorganic phosphate transporter
MKRFSGKGLVPDALTTEPAFLLAVALAAGITVMLATRLGFPISTTHGLTGALVGVGLVNAPTGVNFAVLGKNFITPLLVSPIVAILVGGILYLLFRATRLAGSVEKELCVCVGTETTIHAIPRAAGLLTAEVLPQITFTTGTSAECRQQYAGTFLGLHAGRLLDALHFLSAGAVSFARGLNDTPKIAALLLVAAALRSEWSIAAVAAAMALGGFLNSRRVADTMAHKITGMNPGQGFAANLATAILVNTASYHGLPVSTTHVSVGSLMGIGITTGQAKWKPIGQILLSWVITLPCAAGIAALLAWSARL